MMEWISKLINILKIPLKVLLPSACLFSAFLIFVNTSVLERMNLAKWSQENGFVLGLIFLISSCFIVVYFIYYVKDYILKIYNNLTRNKKTMKKISKMSDKERSIILELYKSSDNTEIVDYADPVIKAMIASQCIYIGNNAPTEITLNNEMLVRATLQPYIRHSIQWQCEKAERKIKRLEKKKRKNNNNPLIEKQISDLKQVVEVFRRS